MTSNDVIANSNDRPSTVIKWNSFPRTTSVPLDSIRGTLEASRYSRSVVEKIQSKQRESLNDRIRNMRMSLAEEPKKKKREKFRMPTLVISKGTPMLSALNEARKTIDNQRRVQTLPKTLPPSVLATYLEVSEDQLTVSSRSSSVLSISGGSSQQENPESSLEDEGQKNDGHNSSPRSNELNLEVKTPETAEVPFEARFDFGNLKMDSPDNSTVGDNNFFKSPPTVYSHDSAPTYVQSPKQEFQKFKSSLTFVPLRSEAVGSNPASGSTGAHNSSVQSPSSTGIESTSESNICPWNSKQTFAQPSNNHSLETEHPTLSKDNTSFTPRSCYQISLSNKCQSDSAKSKTPPSEPLKASGQEVECPDVREVIINRGPFSLGFCIEGGRGSPLGDRPIRVKRLFKGDSSVKGILEPGDVILSVNGHPLDGMTHFQAWNFLKENSEGPMIVKITRESK